MKSIFIILIQLFAKLPICRFRNFLIRLCTRFDNQDFRTTRILCNKYNDICVGRYTYGFLQKGIAPGTIIGSFCSIADNVSIGQMNHPTNLVSTHPFLYYRNRGFVNQNYDNEYAYNPRAIIEDDVWIGLNAVIMPGVTVHRGAVVAAGAIVTKDIPPYEIWGGCRPNA